MGYGDNDRHVVDDLKNYSITKHMQQDSAKRRVVRQSLHFGKTKRIGGYCGEPCSKIVQESPTESARLAIEVLSGFLNLFFGLSQDAEIHEDVSSACF